MSTLKIKDVSVFALLLLLPSTLTHEESERKTHQKTIVISHIDVSNQTSSVHTTPSSPERNVPKGTHSYMKTFVEIAILQPPNAVNLPRKSRLSPKFITDNGIRILKKRNSNNSTLEVGKSANNDKAGDVFNKQNDKQMQAREAPTVPLKYEKPINHNKEVNENSGITSKKKRKARVVKSFSCSHVTGYYDHKFLKLVSQCPDWFTNHTTRTHCQMWDRLRTHQGNELTMLPVQDNEGTVYANVFCAICHSVQTVYPWTTSFDCVTSDLQLHRKLQGGASGLPSESLILDFLDVSSLKKLTELTNCQTKIVPPFPGAIRSCQDHKTFHPEILLRFMDPVKIDSDLVPSQTVSFNLLLNFDFMGDTHILFSASQQIVQTEYIKSGRCEKGETYDSIRNRCRPVKCNQPFYRLMGDSCVLNDQYTSDHVNIFDTPYFDDTAVMTLSVNITFGTSFMMKSLPNLNQLVTEQLADALNIGQDRFQHMNVTFDFTTTNGTVAEIHRLNQLSPEEKQKLHIADWNEQEMILMQNQTIDATFYESTKVVSEEAGSLDAVAPKVSPENNGQALDDMDNLVNEIYNSKISKSGNHNPSDSTSKTLDFKGDINAKKKEEHEFIQLELGDLKEIDIDENHLEPGMDTKKLGKTTGPAPTITPARMQPQTPLQMHTSTPTPMPTTTPNLTPASTSSSSTSTSTTSPSKSTTSSDNWDIFPDILEIVNMPMTMHISFILAPAHHPEASDKSTPVLVKKIRHLIRANSLHIVVKGKQLNVSGAHNTIDDVTKNQLKFCQWGKLVVLSNDKFKLLEINGTNFLYSIEEDKYYVQGLFNVFAIAVGENTADVTLLTYFEQFSSVCVMPRITNVDCRRIDLSEDEYQMNFTNNCIIFEEREYNMSMYTVINATSGSIEICVPPSYDDYHTHYVSPHIVYTDGKCGSQFDDIRTIESYLTRILGRISSIALALVFLTYCLFPCLRTLAGCNIMNLTLALLTAELVFMEDIFEQNDDICSAVTVILHFFFLVAHFWMNVISFDVHRTFSKRDRLVISRQDSCGKKTFYFPRYFAYAWGTPLVIVGICIFIEYSNLFDIRIGYKRGQQSLLSPFEVAHANLTNNSITYDDKKFLQNISIVGDPSVLLVRQACWIQKPEAALSVFGVPVILIFLINCVFFIRTIFSISRTVKMTRANLNRRESSSSTGKTSGKSEAMLYLRMSTVMGLTWVFGFISAIISSVARPVNTTICMVVHVNSVLFTIFNISQGIFIFVAFLCNRRVMQLYVRLYIRLKKIFVRNSQKTTIYSISSTKSTP